FRFIEKENTCIIEVERYPNAFIRYYAFPKNSHLFGVTDASYH
ncbi:hypothetical protein EZS27_037249, partial [termite gut metagenome]